MIIYHGAPRKISFLLEKSIHYDHLNYSTKKHWRSVIAVLSLLLLNTGVLAAFSSLEKLVTLVTVYLLQALECLFLISCLIIILSSLQLPDTDYLHV